MGKRIFLFIVTNLAVVLTLTIVLSVLGVGRYVGHGGLNLGALATFCFVWGMGGAFISLQMSRWIAKRATGMTIVGGHTGDPEADRDGDKEERHPEPADETDDAFGHDCLPCDALSRASVRCPPPSR